MVVVPGLAIVGDDALVLVVVGSGLLRIFRLLGQRGCSELHAMMPRRGIDVRRYTRRV
jgi:hypothetical protein